MNVTIRRKYTDHIEREIDIAEVGAITGHTLSRADRNDLNRYGRVLQQNLNDKGIMIIWEIKTVS